MAYIMLQYDRPTDHTRNWHDYNGRVRDWIARLLQTPGAVSFMAYRTADGSSPNTTTMLEFGTLRRPDAPPAPSTSRPFCRRSARPARTIPRCYAIAHARPDARHAQRVRNALSPNALLDQPLDHALEELDELLGGDVGPHGAPPFGPYLWPDSPQQGL